MPTTSPEMAAEQIVIAFGIPCVTVCQTTFRRKAHRDGIGRLYRTSEVCLAFPFLKASEIADVVHQPQDRSETGWLVAPHRWAVKVLIPRKEARP